MRPNPYKVTWAVLIPKKGIALKRDESKRFNRDPLKLSLLAHAPTKEEAKKIVMEIGDDLQKGYMVYLITDKQFSNLKYDFSRKVSNIMEIMTKRQRQKGFSVGRSRTTDRAFTAPRPSERET